MTDVNPVGAWDDHYATMTEPIEYGTESYERIAAFMGDVDQVEDWGCGGGALRSRLRADQQYIGVDGSATPYADHVTDLRRYRSNAEGVVLRHVLEHNDDWQLVLDRAVASAQRKLAIVVFTPQVASTRVLFREPHYGNVPVVAFYYLDLMTRIPDRFTTEISGWPAPDTAYGAEWAIWCTA